MSVHVMHSNVCVPTSLKVPEAHGTQIASLLAEQGLRRWPGPHTGCEHDVHAPLPSIEYVPAAHAVHTASEAGEQA